jgi:formate-dependent nitrite reductase cytochrome c552 subunit
MKTILLFVLALTLVLGFSIGVRAGVVNTPHDIAAPLEDRDTCVNCHTPHLGPTAATNLLWNRNRTAPNDPTSFYNSATIEMGVGTAANFGPQSSLCMWCHDGGASTLVNYPGPGSVPDSNYDLAANAIQTYANLGGAMDNDHPIAFVYNATLDLQDNGFPAAVNGIITGAVSNNPYPLYSVGATTNTFQCGTCHSVHDTVPYAPKATWNGLGQARGTGQVYFLRASNVASQMCRDCHVNR